MENLSVRTSPTRKTIFFLFIFISYFPPTRLGNNLGIFFFFGFPWRALNNRNSFCGFYTFPSSRKNNKEKGFPYPHVCCCNLCFGTGMEKNRPPKESLMQWNWVSRWHIFKEIYSFKRNFSCGKFSRVQKTFYTFFFLCRMQKRCFEFSPHVYIKMSF